MGIGRELAIQFAERGAWLALAARDVDKLEEVAAQCRQIGSRAIAIPTDVADESQCARLIENAVAEYGKIDTLINNAGLSMFARFDEIQDLSVLERIMQVNYFGSVYCTYHALPHLKATRGRIVGISSLLGKTGAPTRSGYAASKHAMAGFFDTLRIECAGDGVSVTVVYPGFVATAVRERALGPNGKPLGRSTAQETDIMTVDMCARLIMKAVERRKREVIMTARGKAALWLKLIAPKLVDNIARKAIEEGR